jgi:uncharacterized protein YqgC (DUF456 family)
VILLLLYLLLLAGGALGLILSLISLPGLWLMTAVAAIYAVLTHERFIGIDTLLVLLALALLAELLELLLSGAAARQAGGGRKASIGAIVGGIIGGIGFSIIPIPIVATILGIGVGTFVGAFAMEWYDGSHPSHSLRVGWGAVKGRAYGFVGKLSVGGIMMLVIIVMGLP